MKRTHYLVLAGFLLIVGGAAAFGVAKKGSDPWVMSPDSYGPITTDMSKEQILATGTFRDARLDCPRLDMIGGDASIPLDKHGKPEFIDPDRETRTDAGIGRGSTVEDLLAAYPGRVVEEKEPYVGFPDDANYGVSGKRSHLVFNASKGKIENFYLKPGALVKGEKFSADYRGMSC